VAASASPVARRFAEQAANALAEHGSTILLDSARFDRDLGPGASQLPEDDSRNGRLLMWLTNLELVNRFVVLETDTELTEWTRRCLRIADRILIVLDADEDPRPSALEQRISDELGSTVLAAKELVLLHSARKPLSQPAKTWLDNRKISRHHAICLDEPKDMQRFARLTADRGVGLVLGGGGARGMAHLGTIRALEEAGITIDVFGGTSFGAIVAAGAAMEWGWENGYEMLRKFTAHRRSYFRYTLPIVSIMDGHPMDELFKEFYGMRNIEDLRLGFFCTATDLALGQPVVLDSGPLWQSVRASMSIPGIFPPVKIGSNILVDGGVLNNLPVDVMRARINGGTIIASHVNLDEALSRNFTYDGAAVSPWRLLRSRLNPLEKRMAAPSIFDTVSHTMNIGSRWLIPSQKKASDVLIEHHISQYGMFQYDAIAEIVDLGYQNARRAIEEWKTAP
jgi:predicted acylesterase/phospholipase RssA